MTKQEKEVRILTLTKCIASMERQIEESGRRLYAIENGSYAIAGESKLAQLRIIECAKGIAWQKQEVRELTAAIR